MVTEMVTYRVLLKFDMRHQHLYTGDMGHVSFIDMRHDNLLNSTCDTGDPHQSVPRGLLDWSTPKRSTDAVSVTNRTMYVHG